MNQIWCVIWRFQPFHKGHKLLIETAEKENITTLVLIWSSHTKDDLNPYSYEIRKSMILPDCSWKNTQIWALPDFESDNDWKDFFLSYIPKSVKELTLYCWDRKNDSAVQTLQSLQNTLPFSLQIREIPRSIIPISATQIRSALENNDLKLLTTYLCENTIKLIKAHG